MNSFVRVLSFVAFILAGPVVAQEAVVVNDVVESPDVDVVTGTNGVDVFPDGVEIVAVPDVVDVDVSLPGEDVEDLVNLGWPSESDVTAADADTVVPDADTVAPDADVTSPDVAVAPGTDGSDATDGTDGSDATDATDATDGTVTVIVPTPTVPPAAPGAPVNQIPYALGIALALTALVRKGIQATGTPTSAEKGALVLVSVVTGILSMVVLGDASLLTEVLLGALAGAGATGTYELGKQCYRAGTATSSGAGGTTEPTPPDNA